MVLDHVPSLGLEGTGLQMGLSHTCVLKKVLAGKEERELHIKGLLSAGPYGGCWESLSYGTPDLGFSHGHARVRSILFQKLLLSPFSIGGSEWSFSKGGTQGPTARGLGLGVWVTLPR